MSFSMSTYFVDAIMVVVLAGVVDFSSVVDLQERLLSAFDAHRSTARVIIDVSRVDWIHPEGMCALVAAFWRATNSGQGFGLVASHGEIRETLFAAKLDWFHPIYSNLAEAIEGGADEV